MLIVIKKKSLEAKLTKEMKGKSVTRDARGRSTCPGPNHGWGWAEAGHVAPLVATVRPRGDPVEPTQAHASTRRPMVEPRKWPRPRSRNRGPHGSRAHHAPPPTPPPPRTTIAVASVDVAPPDHPTSADHTPWAPSPRFIKKKSTNPVMQKTKRKRTETTANYFSLSSSSLSRERKKEKKRKEKEREALERETRERVAAY